MTSPPDALYAEVRTTDPDVLDATGLSDHLGRLAQLRAWFDAEQVRATRAQRRLAGGGHAADPADSLARDGKQSSKDAKTASERETMCTAVPAFEEALAQGAVSAGHVDALAAASRDLGESETAEFVAEAESLLADATRQGVDAFTKGCRDLAKAIRAHHNSRSDVDELEAQHRQSKISRWVDQKTGMHKTLIECDSLTDRRFWSAIQRERGRLRRRNQQHGQKPSWDRLTVDALVEATDGRHVTTLCEADSGVSLPIDTVRRMACEAQIIPVVLDGNGVALDQGRSKRLATHEQRIAIEAMQSTCSHPDCTVTIDDCRIHHLDPWSAGGRTDLARLAPLCEPHHHLVHEGGWEFSMTPDRFATWSRPDGAEYWTGPLVGRRPLAAAPRN